jgi:predicted signal transduction protein with EAL and GGDEF domain
MESGHRPAYHAKTMTWKTNAYLAGALAVLFVLINIVPTEHDLAMALATAFIAVFVAIVVNLCVAGIRYLRSGW